MPKVTKTTKITETETIEESHRQTRRYPNRLSYILDETKTEESAKEPDKDMVKDPAIELMASKKLEWTFDTANKLLLVHSPTGLIVADIVKISERDFRATMSSGYNRRYISLNQAQNWALDCASKLRL
jgi:hypothetical protein